MRAIADELAFRRRPDCRPLTNAKPISPVLCRHHELQFDQVQKLDIQEWVFAKVLFDATPTELAREIEHRREDVRNAEALGFVCDSHGCLFEEVGVE